MQISSKPFGKLPSGELADLFTLSNDLGTKVKISNFGGIIRSFITKDAHDKLDDIVLGYDQLEPYLTNPCYFGAITGRFTGRIKNGLVNINGQNHQLSCNSGDHHLHGGFKGLDKQLWQASTYSDESLARLTLTHTSPDGSEGFPGELTITVTYTLRANNIFSLEILAECGAETKATLTNISQHSYFNLAGHQQVKLGETVKDHQIELNAERYFPMNADEFPTGEIAAVNNSQFDFTKAKNLNSSNNTFTSIDHYFLLNERLSTQDIDTLATSKPSVSVFEPSSGRRLSIYSNQPSLVVYTGNYLDGKEVGKHNCAYQQHQGLCLEPVNCVNESTTPENKHLLLPSLITPEQPFHSLTHYVIDTMLLTQND